MNDARHPVTRLLDSLFAAFGYPLGWTATLGRIKYLKDGSPRPYCLYRLFVHLGWLHSPSREGLGTCPRCTKHDDPAADREENWYGR